MGIFDHSRFKVVSQAQHPYKHDVSEFFYSNPAVPGASNLSDTLDYIFSVLYPKYIGTYANMVALLVAVPAPTQNDYAVLTDDGDGKSAGYVYRTVDGAAAWHKFYDVDWTTEAILGETVNRTQYMYVHKYGMTDKDDSGSDIVGIYAGQKIYGGDATGQNLTFNANAFDATGYVQTDNTFRPTANGSLDLGTAALKWQTGYFGTSLLAGTLTLASGSITDSSGAISFNNENLSTTGTLASGALTVTGAISATTALTLAPGAGQLVLGTGSITSATGAISFDNENLSTTGTVAGATGSTFGDLTLANGSITSGSGAISFGDENLSTTGTLAAANTTVTRLDVDSIRIDGSTVSVLTANTNLTLAANGSGVIDLQSAMTTLGQTVTGVMAITGQLNADNLRLDGNVLSSTNANGNITLTPNGSGLVEFSSGLFPTSNNAQDIGDLTHRWKDIYLQGGLRAGATVTSIDTLLSLRNINSGVATGMTLFYDAGTSTWLASYPDSEIDHGTLSGLSDDDHAQYALLAGRAGGQTLIGGTLTTQNLTLKANSADTTGSIITQNVIKANADNTLDLGVSGTAFKDVYAKGQFYGMRVENGATIGSFTASASNKGRLAYALDDTNVYVDDGGAWRVVSYKKFLSDTSWNGTDVTKTVTVSSSVIDARKCHWQLLDNANDFAQIFADIRAISATQVTITVSIALASGSYRLIGLE